jgi:hypothetical protein
MKRLAHLCALLLALACAMPAHAATRARCPIVKGPTVSAAAGKHVLLVGLQADARTTRLVSCLVSPKGRAAALARALTRFVGKRKRAVPESLAFNRKRRELLLISRTGSRLRLHRLSRDGGAGDLGTPLPVLRSSGGFRPRLASDAGTACSAASGRCLITWTAHEGSGASAEAAVAGWRFDPRRKSVDRQPFLISQPSRGLETGSAVIALGRRFVSAWSEQLFQRSFLLTSAVPGKGRPRAAFPFRVADEGDAAGAPALTAAGRKAAAVWSEGRNLKLVAFDPDRPGAVRAPLALTGYQGWTAADPAVSFHARKRRYDVAWRRLGDRGGKPSDVFARTATFPGGRLGTPRFLTRRARAGRGVADAPQLVRVGRRARASWFAPLPRRPAVFLAPAS